MKENYTLKLLDGVFGEALALLDFYDNSIFDYATTEQLKSLASIMDGIMNRIRMSSKNYVAGELTLESFKSLLKSILNRETRVLPIVDVDDKGNVRKPSRKEIEDSNTEEINNLSEPEVLAFAKLLYNQVFSKIRTEAIKKYTNGPFLVLQKGMQPQNLTILDDLIEKLSDEKSETSQTKKSKK